VRPDLDPATLSPDDRRDELAAILARGLLRLRDRAALGPPPVTPGHTSPSATQIVPESRDSDVAVRADTWLTVTTG
jgi:hypothetical protein